MASDFVDVKLLWKKTPQGKQFVLSVDGVEVILNPWVGIKCEYYMTHPFPKREGDITKFKPDELSNRIKRLEGVKACLSF